jgi:MoxR-like ATPase
MIEREEVCSSGLPGEVSHQMDQNLDAISSGRSTSLSFTVQKNGNGFEIPEIFHYKGKIIHLCQPIELKEKVIWRGQDEMYGKLVASWISNNPRDPPLNPLLLGPSGMGKTTLAMAVAQDYDRPFFMMNCQGDMEPNDLTVSLNIDADKNIQYTASPVFTAALVGGVVILDEFTRLPQHAFASMASLLDHRMYIEAGLLPGLRISAHPDFRIGFTSNFDSFSDLPDYIESRLKPRIIVNNPSLEELRMIIDSHLTSPCYSEEFKQKLIEHLIQAKNDGRFREFSTRDAITVGRLAQRFNKIFSDDKDLNIVRAMEAVNGHM